MVRTMNELADKQTVSALNSIQSPKLSVFCRFDTVGLRKQLYDFKYTIIIVLNKRRLALAGNILLT